MKLVRMGANIAGAMLCLVWSSLPAQTTEQMNNALIAMSREMPGGPTIPARQGPETFPADIQKILDLPEDQIDTGRAALTFAHEIDPGLDVEKYSARIDQMAAEAKQVIDRYGKYDPDSIIRALNTYYHFGFGARYDFAPNGRRDMRNYFIVGIMDRHVGQCMNLPMLYQAIAQRLGYPVYTVQAPEHSFLRYVDPRLPVDAQNIEVTGKNIGSSTDAEYAHDFNISERGIKSGAYLRTMTRREWLGILLMENAVAFSRAGYWDRTILYLEKAQELDPHDPYYPKNLAEAYKVKAQRADTSEHAAQYRKKAVRAQQRATDLGWVVDPDAITRAEAVARSKQ